MDIAGTQQALTGIEGTMEYAIDAPWRIEPVRQKGGSYSYGSIPIQISIHDADQVDLDFAGSLGKFCKLTVTEDSALGVHRSHYLLSSLEEIEKSGRWLSPSSSAPLLKYKVCRPSESTTQCEEMRGIAGHAEWHAVAWFTPNDKTPGADIPLRFEVELTRGGLATCDSTDPNDFFTLRNYATVHLGEAPLPRFGAGWLYGDLHYHSQGTDNEGESAYHYRGVIRALGALGLDFAVAAEHASNAHQWIDVDVGADGAHLTDGALRDMSLERFRFLLDQLHLEHGGINLSTAMDGPGALDPQSYLAGGNIPQIFLGGEVDAIPEVASVGPGNWKLAYGNGLEFDVLHLCSGWNKWVAWGNSCLGSYLYEPVSDGFLIKDIQGENEYLYSREHLIYIPNKSSDPNAFVASNTGKYGGARRRLWVDHGDQKALLPELKNQAVAFIAHPLNAGGGDAGPGSVPWTAHMYEQAWRSPDVLGMQLWNGSVRLKTKVDNGFQSGDGEARDQGYFFDGGVIDDEAEICDGQPREGFETGLFELQPYYSLENRSFSSRTTELEEKLHHGAAEWEKLLRRGLDTTRTSALSWLPAGEPRRFFMAGGSDAHGDLNYRREGYMRHTDTINDNALGKARNLVFLGDPELPRDTNDRPDWCGKPAERHSQSQLVDALKEGNFSVTDGPALRIIVDKNSNGIIDDGDTPMGGIVELFGETELPIIVQWISTPEFGPIARVHLYVGVRSGGGVDGKSRTYAPANQGPRNAAILPGATPVSSYTHNGRTYVRMEDNYWKDPTGDLSVSVPSGSLGGQALIRLPIEALEPALGHRAERLYVRAFAETAVKDLDGCQNSAAARRKGACTQHYAFTNPVWAITPGGEDCVATDRSMDQDGDGKPDGCDPCPEHPNDMLCDLPDWGGSAGVVIDEGNDADDDGWGGSAGVVIDEGNDADDEVGIPPANEGSISVVGVKK